MKEPQSLHDVLPYKRVQKLRWVNIETILWSEFKRCKSCFKNHPTRKNMSILVDVFTSKIIWSFPWWFAAFLNAKKARETRNRFTLLPWRLYMFLRGPSIDNNFPHFLCAELLSSLGLSIWSLTLRSCGFFGRNERERWMSCFERQEGIEMHRQEKQIILPKFNKHSPWKVTSPIGSRIVFLSHHFSGAFAVKLRGGTTSTVHLVNFQIIMHKWKVSNKLSSTWQLLQLLLMVQKSGQALVHMPNLPQKSGRVSYIYIFIYLWNIYIYKYTQEVQVDQTLPIGRESFTWILDPPKDQPTLFGPLDFQGK